MSWRDSSDTGEGHSAIWIHPSQNLYFRFMGSKSPAINQEWIDATWGDDRNPVQVFMSTEAGTQSARV